MNFEESMFRNIIKNNKYALICFGFGVIESLLILGVSNLLSIEGYCIVEGDLKDIYIPLIRNFYRDLFGGRNVSFSWNLGLGINTSLAYALDVLSPFNFLYYLLDGIDDNVITILLIAIQSGLTASVMERYLNRVCVKQAWIRVCCSMMYAFCSFQIAYNYTNIMWLDAIWILPLIFGGIDDIFQDKKMTIALLAYTYIFITNFYMGYILGVISVFYVVAKIISIKNKVDSVQNFIFKWLKSVLGAVGISAFVWMPALLFLINGRAGDSTPFDGLDVGIIDVYNQLFIGEVGTLYHTGPNIYCGVLVLIVLPIGIIRWRKNKACLGEYVFVLFGAICACIFEPLYVVLHAFDAPDGWEFRFSFVVSMLLCVLVAKMLDEKIVVDKLQLAIIITINILIYGLGIIWQKSGNTTIGLNDVSFLLVNSIFMLLYTIGLIYYAGFRRNLGVGIILAVTFAEIVFSGYCYYYRCVEMQPEIPRKLYTNWKKSSQEIESLDDKNRIDRIIVSNEFNSNASAYTGYNGISYFGSAENYKLRKTLSQIGLWSTPRSVRSVGLNEATKMLLGVKYDVVMPGYDALMRGECESSILICDKSLSVGYMVNNNILKCNIDSSNAFNNINEVISGMVGGETNIFVDVADKLVAINEYGLIVEKDNKGYYIEKSGNSESTEYPFLEYLIDEEGNVYAYVDNLESKYMEGSFALYGGEENSFYQNGLLSISYIKEMVGREDGLKSLIVYSDNSVLKQHFENIFFFELDETALNAVYQTLSNQQLEMNELTNGYFKGKIIADKGILFLSIPYDKGWSAYVNGEKQKIIPILNDAFCGIEIKEDGTYQIEMSYDTPGKWMGIIISCVSCLSLACTIIVKRLVRKDVNDENAA